MDPVLCPLPVNPSVQNSTRLDRDQSGGDIHFTTTIQQYALVFPATSRQGRQPDILPMVCWACLRALPGHCLYWRSLEQPRMQTLTRWVGRHNSTLASLCDSHLRADNHWAGFRPWSVGQGCVIVAISWRQFRKSPTPTTGSNCVHPGAALRTSAWVWHHFLSWKYTEGQNVCLISIGGSILYHAHHHIYRPHSYNVKYRANRKTVSITATLSNLGSLRSPNPQGC